MPESCEDVPTEPEDTMIIGAAVAAITNWLGG